MGYADRTVNIYDKKVFGLTEWGTRLRDYIEDVARGIDRGIHPVPGILFTPIDLDITVADEFTFTPTTSDYDSGLGHVIEDVPAAVLEHVPFENAAVTDYDVGVKRIQIPYLTETCVRDGKVQYRAWEERIGDMAVPAAVVYAAGTLSIEPGSVAELGHDFTGRQFVVWLNTPVVDGAGAIEVCTGYFNAGQTWVDLVGTLGQGVTPSVVAADYRVALLGPMVKKFSSLKSSTIGIVYIGTITGGGAGNPPAAKDLTDQFVYPDMGSGWYDIFEVCAHGNTKVRVRAYAADGAGEPQISVLEDTTGNRTWQVQRDGDMEMGNAVDWPVVSPAIKFVTTTRTADVYLDPGVTDYLRIVPSVATVRTKIVSNVVEIEEGIEAVGTLKFDDVNTGAQIPFSSAADTAIDASLPQNILGAINEQADTALALTTMFKAAVLSGGTVTMPGGTDLTVASGTFLINGQFKTYPLKTLTVVANRYIYASAATGQYEQSAALAGLTAADVLVAYVLAGGGGPTATTDARRLLRHVGDRIEVYVGSNAGTLLTGCQFNTIAEAVAAIDLIAAHEARGWTIRVVGDTTETATPITIAVDGTQIVGSDPISPVVSWAADTALFHVTGDGVTIAKLRAQSTAPGAIPAAAPWRQIVTMAIANRCTVSDIVCDSGSRLNGVAYLDTCTLTSFDRVAVYQAADYGIALEACNRCAVRNSLLYQNGASGGGAGYAGLSGIAIYGSCSACTVADCDIYDWEGEGVDIDASVNNHVRGCRVSGTGLAGLVIDDGTDNAAIGNEFMAVAVNEGAPAAAVKLRSAAVRNRIIGNTIDSNAALPFSILFAAAATQYNVAIGNYLYGDAISDAGANNFYQTAAPDSYPLNA